jgi:hypothetical protein
MTWGAGTKAPAPSPIPIPQSHKKMQGRAVGSFLYFSAPAGAWEPVKLTSPALPRLVFSLLHQLKVRPEHFTEKYAK